MKNNFNKILIIHPGGIGDLIMFTPVIKILKNNFPDAKIDIFAGYTPESAGVFEEGDVINKFFANDFRKNSLFDKLRFIYKLRKEKYDLSLLPADVNSLKAVIINFLIGAKKRIGGGNNEDKHKIEASVDLLKKLNLKIDYPLPAPFLNFNKEKKFAEEFIEKNNLKNKILIGFSIGSGTKQRFKLWSKENFIKLGQKILENNPDTFILLFGSPSEKEICSEVKNYLGENAILIIGQTLSQVAALIDKCKIFVTSDIGPCHIASVTKTDLIVIFGPTIPERTGPVGSNVYIISEKCSNRYHDIFTPKYDINKEHQCLKKITPDIVFNKIEKFL